MAIRSLVRNTIALGAASDKAAPIYVDKDDNRVKVIPGGNGSTTEVILQEAQGANVAEVVTATRTLTAAESGKTVFLNSATEFVTTLPAPAIGLRFTFIVAAAPSGASYTVVTNGSANIIVGNVLSSDLNNAADADFETSGGDTISFVDGVATKGDRVDLECDGTSWYMTGACSAQGGITITTAS